MENFDYNKYCVQKLLHEIPEIYFIQGRLKEKLTNYLNGELLSHLIYEDIFSCWILNLISKEKLTNKEKKLVKKSFKLLEDLATHKNFNVRNVAEVSFIEPLLDKVYPTKKLINYLLPNSLKLAQEIGPFRFGFNPHTWEKEE